MDNNIFFECEEYLNEVKKVIQMSLDLKTKANILLTVSAFICSMDSSPKDVNLVEFIQAKDQNWEKSLPTTLVELIRKFSENHSNETLKQTLLVQINNLAKETHQKRYEIEMLLSECPEDVKTKIKECETIINTYKEQIASISEKMGEASAKLTLWKNILKEVEKY